MKYNYEVFDIKLICSQHFFFHFFFPNLPLYLFYSLPNLWRLFSLIVIVFICAFVDTSIFLKITCTVIWCKLHVCFQDWSFANIGQIGVLLSGKDHFSCSQLSVACCLLCKDWGLMGNFLSSVSCILVSSCSVIFGLSFW